MSRFRCDNGKGQYDNTFFRGILKTYGIAFEPSPPYTPHKNGTSERMIRTLVTKARALLLDSRLPDKLWAEAVHTANYLHTRSPSRSIGGRTLYELFYGTTPDLSHLRRFDCIADKLLPKEQRLGKFGGRVRPCAFVGYVHNTQTSGKWCLVDQGGPERPWFTTQHHGPAGAPGPLLVHLDPAWSTSCNHTPEIVDQGGSRWTRGTTGTMELGVEPGALWSCFYILLMEDLANLGH